MKKRRRKKISFTSLIIIFIISTFTLSVGYSLLYETLSVKGSGNLVFEDDTETSSEFLKFSYTTNSWYSEGKYYYQIDGVLENISEYTVEGWKVVLQFPENIELQGGWNGEFLIDGNKLTITPAIYNNTIHPNSSITIGIQIILSSDRLQIDKIVLNGTPIGITSVVDNNENTESNMPEDNDTGFDADILEETNTGMSESNSSEEDNVETNEKITTNNENLIVTTELKAEWLAADKYISQHNLIITNNTEYIVENWEVKIALPENVVFSQIWEGNYINADGVLKISGIDYNKTLQPNTSINILMQFESGFEAYVPEIISE